MESNQKLWLGSHALTSTGKRSNLLWDWSCQLWGSVSLNTASWAGEEMEGRNVFYSFEFK